MSLTAVSVPATGRRRRVDEADRRLRERPRRRGPAGAVPGRRLDAGRGHGRDRGAAGPGRRARCTTRSATPPPIAATQDHDEHGAQPDRSRGRPRWCGAARRGCGPAGRSSSKNPAPCAAAHRPPARSWRPAPGCAAEVDRAVGRTVVSLGRAAASARRRARTANRRSTRTATTTSQSRSSTSAPRPANGRPAKRSAPAPPVRTSNWVAQTNAGLAGAADPGDGQLEVAAGRHRRRRRCRHPPVPKNPSDPTGPPEHGAPAPQVAGGRADDPRRRPRARDHAPDRPPGPAGPLGQRGGVGEDDEALAARDLAEVALLVERGHEVGRDRIAGCALHPDQRRGQGLDDDDVADRPPGRAAGRGATVSPARASATAEASWAAGPGLAGA